jgi:glucose-6-phosphate isomerase
MKNEINNNNELVIFCNELTESIIFDCSYCNIPEKNIHDKLSFEITTALNEMSELENGLISNKDENRMVGHYWLRTPEIAPEASITSEINNVIEQIVTYAKQVLSGNFLNEKGQSYQDVVLVGIGGSALGPQLVYDALDKKEGLRLHFIDNTDPDGICRVLDNINDISRTLFLIVSKSGGTTETYNGEVIVKRALEKHHLRYSKQMIAITLKDSELWKRATSENWSGIFEIWDWVGGRTSVMSAVGLLPAALHGIDIKSFLSGARDMDRHTRKFSVMENPAMLMASMWLLLGDRKGDKSMVILPYRDRLLLFSRYLQQLVMESIGKKFDRDGKLIEHGISVFGNKGSTDQHAFVQQLRDGRNDFFTIFIDVFADDNESPYSTIVQKPINSTTNCGDYLQAFLFGTREALLEGNRSSLTISLPRLNEYFLGALIALFERAVGFYSSMVNINAYHQPGVEAGKKAAASFVELQAKVQSILLKLDEKEIDLEKVLKLANATKYKKEVYSMILRLVETGRTEKTIKRTLN